MQYKHACHLRCRPLWTHPGSSPMSPLGVVPDFITSFHLNPPGNGMILPLFIGQESLDPESLMRRHCEEHSTTHTMMVGQRRPQYFLTKKRSEKARISMIMNK